MKLKVLEWFRITQYIRASLPRESWRFASAPLIKSSFSMSWILARSLDGWRIAWITAVQW